MSGRFHAGSRAGGFTLLEMLIALALFSALSVVLYAGFRIAARSWEGVERAAARADEVRIVHEALRGYFASALPFAERERGRSVMLFRGTDERVEFAAIMPSRIDRGGVYRIAVGAAAPTGANGTMTLELARLLVEDDPDDVEPQRRTLVDAIDSVRFSYFGAPDPRDEAQWHEEWPESQRLPRLVRMQVTTQDARDWPVLTVRIPAEVPRLVRGLGGARRS